MIDPQGVLITGAGGQLGTAFCDLLPQATACDRAMFDLADLDRLDSRLDELDPEVLLNCAAYTAVDRAEAEEAMATVINGHAVARMAGWAAKRRRRFVTYSTDYVFAGDAVEPYLESSPTDPINAYGRSKRHGEIAALEHPTSLVVRTSWLVSGKPPNFVATMLRHAAAGNPLRVVSDQQGSPTIAADLAAYSLRAIEADVTGLLHATNQGVTTWHGLATAAIEIAGLDTSLLTPCSTADYPTPAGRPAYSVLASERNLDIEPMPLWRTSLPDVVGALLNAR